MPIPSDSSTIRLNKYIAERLAMGRRQVDFLIEKGKVRVNGATPILGARVNPDHDTVTVSGKTVPPAHTFTYLMLHKPTGYVCSRRQQGASPTIYELLPPEYHHLKPVGRLDKDSSGLILLTNDGDFAFAMTHPKFVKIKRYGIMLDAPLQPLHRQMISDHGLQLPDGLSKLELERLEDSDNHQWLVTMHEGRNRQIRRTFAALGYTVTRLHRVQFGSYYLDDLTLGKWKAVKKT